MTLKKDITAMTLAKKEVCVMLFRKSFCLVDYFCLLDLFGLIFDGGGN